MSSPSDQPIEHVRIDTIRVGERLREVDTAKVVELVESIKQVGLLQPVVISVSGALVAGAHRLEAVRRLGWEEVPVVHLPEGSDPVLAEIDENLVRADLDVLHQAEHLHLRDQRLRELGLRAPAHRPGKAATAAGFRTTKELAADLGVSERSLQTRVQIAKGLSPDTKALLAGTEVASATRQLVALARVADAAEQLEVALRLVEDPRQPVDAIRRQLQRDAAAARTAEIRSREVIWPPAGRKYRTVVLDPPWPMRLAESQERPRQVESLPYPTMNIEEIKALPVGDIAAEAAHVYLWTPNRHLPAAFEIVAAWGFAFSTLLTWKKKVGPTPWWWRQVSEHVVFAVRGGLRLSEVGIDTVFEGNSARHSEKPEEFFQIVERASPGPRLEMFSRKARAGWDAHGLETEAGVRSV